MTDVQKRAAKKTALLVFVAVALIVIISYFPFLGGYIMLGVFTAMLIGGVYAMFFMWEETKEWDKRREQR